MYPLWRRASRPLHQAPHPAQHRERAVRREHPESPRGELHRCAAADRHNGSWGYDRDNLNVKPVDLLVRMLVDGVSKNGNMLLNVGPTGRGDFDATALATLEGIGAWMSRHQRSIHDAGPSRYRAPADTRYTQRGNRLYLHLFTWPFGHVHLPDLAGKVEYAQFLHDASEIKYREIDPSITAQNTGLGGQPPGTLTLTLPVVRPDVAVPVVELFLRQDT
ncbi:alpha-L-fucosidase [Streptomyces asiaticus]|uniref:alpha-L-fucosidase n=1 Tax=Streptomyces asiaticus TaxID=114695 RepID=UPI0039BEA355